MSHRYYSGLNLFGGYTLGDNMSPNTKEAFEQFAEHANRSGLLPYDWQRFYRFVRVAFRCRSKIWEQEVEQALITVGFNKEYANELCTIYCHCWRMLSKFDSPKETSRWWKQTNDEMDALMASAEARLSSEYMIENRR